MHFLVCAIAIKINAVKENMRSPDKDDVKEGVSSHRYELTMLNAYAKCVQTFKLLHIDMS